MVIADKNSRLFGATVLLVSVFLLAFAIQVLRSSQDSERREQPVLPHHAAELLLIREILADLPTERMETVWRERAQKRLSDAGILQAEFSCKRPGQDRYTAVILPFPETLRVTSVVYQDYWKEDDVLLGYRVITTPDLTERALGMTVENEHCNLSVALMPAGLQIPPDLPLIDVMNNHLRAGRIHEVLDSLDSLPPVEARDRFESTLLIEAAAAGADRVVIKLVEMNAEIDAKDQTGQSPLAKAAAKGHASTVSFLLEQGADVRTRDNLGYTPMIHAAAHGHVDVLQLLSSYGAPVDDKSTGEYFGGGSSALHRASTLCKPAAVRWLLENGADPDVRDADGATPLIGVASRDCIAVAISLIEHGADVNARSRTRPMRSALCWAAAFGEPEMIELLLNAGAEVGREEIQAAREQERDDVVTMLKEARRPGVRDHL